MKLTNWVVLLLCLPMAMAGSLAVEGIRCMLWGLSEEEIGAPPSDPRVLRGVDHAGKLPLGSAAPDFTLPRVSDARPLHLADLQGAKPVVLVFGGFT